MIAHVADDVGVECEAVSGVLRQSAPSSEWNCVRTLNLLEQVTVRRRCHHQAAVASD
jgi:hypothetical protein